MAKSKAQAKKADHKVAYRKPVPPAKPAQPARAARLATGERKAASGSTTKLPQKNQYQPMKQPKVAKPVGLLIGLAVVACLVVAAVMLVPVARDYYIAMRDNDRLQAELQAVTDRNDQIQQQINNLNTPEGIEDRAREEFGWVRAGEHAVNITGLETLDSSTALPAAVDADSVTLASTWWNDLLDAAFGLQVSTQEPPAGQSQSSASEQ
jgi:cell division protein FtsL